MTKMKIIAAAMVAGMAIGGMAPAEAAKVAHKPVATVEVTVPAKPDAKVRKVQEMLNEFGANLKVDGKMGAETRAMIIEFKKATGMKATDKIDAETIAKIEHALGHPGPGKTATKAIRALRDTWTYGEPIEPEAPGWTIWDEIGEEHDEANIEAEIEGDRAEAEAAWMAEVAEMNNMAGLFLDYTLGEEAFTEGMNASEFAEWHRDGVGAAKDHTAFNPIPIAAWGVK